MERAPPPTQFPLVITKTKEAYLLWHNYLVNLKRIDRYTTGQKIDETFLNLLELLFRASFAYDKFEKINLVSQAIGKRDLLNFFLQIAWEYKIITSKIYTGLISCLDEIGRMLGGWKKSLIEKTPARR